MTCREKLAIEKPACIQPGQPGGCFGCPHMYGYLKMPLYCKQRFILGPAVCTACWDRLIIDEGTDEK